MDGNNKALESKFKQNNDDIMKFIDRKTDESRAKLIDERKRMDTILEGRCQAYVIDIERKVLGKMGTVLTETHAMKDEILARVEFAKNE